MELRAWETAKLNEYNESKNNVSRVQFLTFFSFLGKKEVAPGVEDASFFVKSPWEK